MEKGGLYYQVRSGALLLAAFWASALSHPLATATVRAARICASALHTSHSKSVFDGGFVCAQRARNNPFRRFRGGAVLVAAGRAVAVATGGEIILYCIRDSPYKANIGGGMKITLAYRLWLGGRSRG